MLAKKIPHAETLIRNTNARVTSARVKVLDFLLAQSRSFTHHEIAARLSGSNPVDAVTLYRVLDWLAEHGLIHRVAGADQVWRFSASGGAAAHEHAHFHCTGCAAVICFTEMKLPRKRMLPAGFQAQEMDLSIKGLCPECA